MTNNTFYNLISIYSKFPLLLIFSLSFFLSQATNTKEIRHWKLTFIFNINIIGFWPKIFQKFKISIRQDRRFLGPKPLLKGNCPERIKMGNQGRNESCISTRGLWKSSQTLGSTCLGHTNTAKKNESPAFVSNIRVFSERQPRGEPEAPDQLLWKVPCSWLGVGSGQVQPYGVLVSSTEGHVLASLIASSHCAT